MNLRSFPSDSYFQPEPTPAPAPETVTRREVKSYKAQIKRLQSKIKAEEKRLALQRLVSDMEAKLNDLRNQR